jgi:Uma2 family endonuclease
MSSTLAAPAPQEPRKRLTIADVAAFPRTLPSGDVDYELDDGRLVIMAPPGDMHGSAQSKFAAALVVQGELRGLGKARTEVGVILRRNPDRLVCPDALFIMTSSLPLRRSSEGYLETIPELVVEVRSPNDTGPEVQAKVDEYLAAGVRVAWVADPDRRTVTAYRTGQAPQVFGALDSLTIPDVIPGFQTAIVDVVRD